MRVKVNGSMPGFSSKDTRFIILTANTTVTTMCNRLHIFCIHNLDYLYLDVGDDSST